ncbi:TrkH family potassium uptake protein [Palleronia caenipelagi]|uniref:Trk system potassium uptake protein n=1 Tax=Palleronia caenipelagi TaxID=2489174 RepID=A0A547Q5R5_9RHOB|nr:TrkH family potassium uptake protein [Palleronia caenipelagi]TRD21721.1 TrkH family potassium uptake protein [Palleronia caenipelagi]
MIDLRPVGYVIGILVAFMGVTMVIPMGFDIAYNNGHWSVFLRSMVIASLSGVFLALACSNANPGRLTVQQTFLLTSLVWFCLPIFGGIPFYLTVDHATVTDAFFESMSALTTTGSTVYSGLEHMPEGILVWRSMLQWFGGIGIIVVAMVFLPELRVGGMQIFKTESFDTMGKILPRAAEIARQISTIYLLLTFACFTTYLIVGMTKFDALNFALTTVSTGGFAPTDESFGRYQGLPEYVASVFMVAASLPFVRYVQLIAGTARPILTDPQVRAFVIMILMIAFLLCLFQIVVDGEDFEQGFREALFNITSIASGTGYASVDYQLWGVFPMVVFFFVGLVGGCAGSTCCSVKIFRYQILFSAIASQIRRIHNPHGVFAPKFGGRRVSEEVLSSVMGFFVIFVVTLGVMSVAMSLTGLDFVTSVSGAATAVGNIGPGLGPIIGPAGNFGPLNDAAKWICIFGMYVGRLELLAVYVIFTSYFWRT